ncbi:hypothetical protein C8R46DRAFT_1040549 [Mycena filopes]|nr:hypothetical protein C8R46DRAFT_1040549 [Mycena filopes]
MFDPEELEKGTHCIIHRRPAHGGQAGKVHTTWLAGTGLDIAAGYSLKLIEEHGISQNADTLGGAGIAVWVSTGGRLNRFPEDVGGGKEGKGGRKKTINPRPLYRPREMNCPRREDLSDFPIHVREFKKSWNGLDDDFSYEEFFWKVVGLLSGDEGRVILDRFNFNVFGRAGGAKKSAAPVANIPDEFELLQRQRAAKRARAEAAAAAASAVADVPAA